MKRLDKDEYFLQMAELVSRRSTCLRRSVGCVLVNSLGHVLATGYNGVAAGTHHCNEVTGYTVNGQDAEPLSPHIMSQEPRDIYPTPKTPFFDHACEGAQAKSGENLDKCQAIHAEQNALLQCHDVQAIHTVYVTHAPCITCTKLLMNTSAKRVVFRELYPHKEAAYMWIASRSDRTWEHKPSEKG